MAPLLDAPQWSGVGDAYAVLGVRPDAEPEAIEGAYKALAKKYHPDRHPGDPVMDARMKAITAAHAEVLRRRGKRRKRR
jgi:molecular chaperone DnaJ